MTGSFPVPAIAADPPPAAEAVAPAMILSFDIEEHDRIEAAAAAGLISTLEQKTLYADRMEFMTRRLLERLAAANAQATFFIVGEIAKSHPKLVAAIAAAGHEVAAHSWNHRRVSRFDPASFAEDLRITKDALEQTSGKAVFGFRAPTFSITRDTAWALDVLAEAGYVYDSSIYPVRHDRYGIPDAPRSPFFAVGPGGGAILELPPVTYRMLGQNLPVAGGGYFRLLPLWVTKRSIQQLLKQTCPPVAMMYFHPWEFDRGQPRLKLPFISKWRTYVGVKKNFAKLEAMLNLCVFRRAVDVVSELYEVQGALPRFEIKSDATVISARVAVEREVNRIS